MKITHFTESEKDIIRKILSKKIRSIQEFFEVQGLIKYQLYKNHQVPVIKNRTNEEPIIEFIALLKWLEKENLIFTIDQKNIVNDFMICEELTKEQIDDGASHISLKLFMNRINEYQKKEIIRSKDLQAFVERDFVTADQYRFIESEKTSNFYKRLTIILTLAAIGLNIIVSGFNIWNDLESKAKAKTEAALKKSSSLPDTTIVKIANQSAFPDTLRMITIPNKSKN